MIKPVNGWGGDPKRACVDCLNYRPTCEHEARRCLAHACRTFHLVKGYEAMDPEAARVSGPCGPEGRLFEPVPPPTWLQRHGFFIVIGFLLSGLALKALWGY